MNVLDLIQRELNRISADFRAYAALPADDARRSLRGLALGGRITAYLHAEERVLYPALIAVAFALRPALLAHQRRLKRRTGDALGRLRRGDTLGHAAMLKLEQEMLRYARCHQLELLPRLRSVLGERELRLLNGEMLLTLAAHRMPEGWQPLPLMATPAWAHSQPAAAGSSRTPFDAAHLPMLCDVVEAHDPMPKTARPAGTGKAGVACVA
jgi:hypothetical protein